MSNAVPTDVLLGAITTCVDAAWPECVSVDYGEPLTAGTLPYAVINPGAVSISFTALGASASRPSQSHSFRIIGRFPHPTDPTQNLVLLKIAKANLLIAQLQTGPNFAGIAGLPLVTEVDYGEPDDKTENSYEVTLTFVCFTTADHH